MRHLRQNHARGLPALLFVALLLSPGALRAASSVAPAEPDPPHAPTEFELPPLEVRARRGYPRAEEDRAASASVITREELERPGVDLPLLLDLHPGVRVTRMGGLGSSAAVSIRGSTAEQVRVYVDGVLQNRADGAPVDLGALALGPVERVEVYRSFAPVRMGGSAIGGVVSVTTRRAEERRLEVEAGYGSFLTRSARALYAEPGRHVRGLISLDYQGTAGDFPFLSDGGTLFDPNDDFMTRRRNNHSDAVTVLGKAEARLGPHATLVVQDTFAWRTRGLPTIALYPTERARHTEMQNTAAAALSVSPAGGGTPDVRAVSELQAPLWSLRGSHSSTRAELFDPEGEVGLGQRDLDDRSHVLRLDTSLSWPFAVRGLHLTPSALMAYRFEHFTPHDRLAATQMKRPSGRHVVESTGELAWGVAAIDTTLIASGGFEWAQSRLFGRDAMGRVAEHADTAVETAWSARLGLVQETLPFVVVTANGGRSARMPTLFELFGDAGHVRGNHRLVSETGWFVDGGLLHEARYLPRPHRLRVELTAFGAWSDNLIQFVQTSQQTAVAENIAAARQWGLEAALRADLWGHLRLSAAVTYLRSENRSAVRAHRGRDLPFRPRWQWHARLEGYVALGWAAPESGVFVELDGASGNALDPANLARLPARAYLACGLHAWLMDRRLRVQVAVRNVTDERTVDFAGFPLPGRSVFMTVFGRVL